MLSDTYSFSDSLHLYVQTAFLGGFAAIISFVLLRKDKVKQIVPWLRTILAFILAFLLIKYGLEKWTQLQFPAPPPNILHSEVGTLDKDILFWSLMGTSKAYAGFMGFVEIFAGLLLFFRKTRLIGGFFALGIFANVFALNVGFDITVKLLSLALLLTSLYIITPSLRSLYQLLSSKEVDPIQSRHIEIKPIMHRLLKGVAVTLILLECILPLFDKNFSIPSDKSLNHQTYAVVATQHYPDGIAPLNYKHLHFHPHGFLITETFDGQFQSYPIQHPEGANQFKLNKSSHAIVVVRNGDEWIFIQKNQLLWRCKRVRNEALPLLQDDFHWTVEGMLPK
ncbi:MAG: hypothetical protein Crog2KO_24050 [Crocinitomicaceae bacterium]